MNGAERFLAGTSSCRIEVEDIDAMFNEYQQRGVSYGPETVIEKTAGELVNFLHWTYSGIW